MHRGEGLLNVLHNYANEELENLILQDRLKYIQACERLVQFTMTIYDPLVQLPKASSKSVHKKKKNQYKEDKGQVMESSSPHQLELGLWCINHNQRTMENLFDFIANEVWYKIFKQLDAKTVSNISVVCHRWKDICKQPEFLLHWEEIHLLYLVYTRASSSSRNAWKTSSSRHILLQLVS